MVQTLYSCSTSKFRQFITLFALPQHIDSSKQRVLGSGGWDLVREFGRRIAAVQLEPRSTSFLLQRISVAIQRGNT